MAHVSNTLTVGLALGAAVLAKLVVLLGVLAAPVIGAAIGDAEVAAAAGRMTQTTLSERLCQWDCGWYLATMRAGYDAVAAPGNLAGEANWAFFPAFPVVVRVFTDFTGTGLIAAGVTANTLLSLVCAALLYVVVRDALGERAGVVASAAFSLSPFGLYLTVPYSEALYNALSLAVVFFSVRRRWLACGVCLALLSATRPTALYLVPAVVLIAWELGVFRERPLSREQVRFGVCLLLMPLGLACFMVHLAEVTGDALAFARVQVAWQRELGEPLGRLLDGLTDGGRDSVWAIAGVAALAAAWGLWRAGVPPYRAASLLLGLTVLLSTATALTSLHRLSWAFWPAYLLLGAMAHRWRATGIVAALATSATALFAVSAAWAYGWSYLV